MGRVVLICSALVHSYVRSFIFHHDQSDASEINTIEGGKDLIKEELHKLGPVSPREWRLIVISMLLLLFWSTEKVLHPIDSASITIIALGVMLMPKIGVMTWKQDQ